MKGAAAPDYILRVRALPVILLYNGRRKLASHLHAIALIAVTIAVGALCILAWRERPTASRVIASLLAGLIFYLVVPGYFCHLCDRGQPGVKLLLWMAGFIAILSCVSEWKIAIPATAVFSILMAILCRQYVDLAHRPDFTGNPRSALEGRAHQHLMKRAKDEIAEMAMKDSASYPAGWLEEALFIHPTLKEDLRNAPARSESSISWHTWLTRLWRRQTFRVSLWYPGGMLEGGANGLEWHDRPMK